MGEITTGSRVRLLDPMDSGVRYSYESEQKVETMIGRIVVLNGEINTYWPFGNKCTKIEGIVWPIKCMEKFVDPLEGGHRSGHQGDAMKALLYQLKNLATGWEKQAAQLSRRRGAGFRHTSKELRRVLERFTEADPTQLSLTGTE